MRLRRSTLISIIILLVWLVLTWRMARWIAPHPPTLYYLRAGFVLIGIAGFAGYLLLRPKKPGEATQGWVGMANAEIDFSFSEASKHLAATGVKNINTLPSVFILGDTGTAKTSVIAKSGLEPDLLAGYAYEEYVIAPTRALNVWYARETLYVDPAGAVISEPSVRKKLFKKFAPIRLRSVLGGKQPPPRSVVFTIDCEIFLQQGTGDAFAVKARHFQTILSELSEELGANFPVYVLFTKTDRLPYFRDYVANFTEAEATEIFGKTLPLQTATARGVYAEQEARRLTDAFQDLYYSLCDRRPTQLSREHSAGQLPNIYEFPREFAKLRPLLVQFLVDLCRPTQLRTSPFLRGFYFTGVRPISVPDLVPATMAPQVEEQGFDAGATRIFNPRGSAQKLQAEALQSGSRRIPQWVFLTHLFSDLILVDQPAMVATRGSVKLNFWRRSLLAGAAALAILLCVWWILSYGNNKYLIREATGAAHTVPPSPLGSGQIASSESLQRLAKVRDTLATLKDWDKNGTPVEYRGGLYAGNSLIPPLRTTYYALFRRLLLSPTQQTLIALCMRPEDYAARGFDFGYIYNGLRVYLITTNHHEKSTQEFTGPVLMEHWQKGQAVDGERKDFARQDFDFYSDELPQENPYPKFANPDSYAVENARAYLKKQGQVERIYQQMLLAAGAGLKPIIFNEDYPESRGLIINTYRVDPAFSKKGYEVFFKLLGDPDKYFHGEEWVLGQMPGQLDNKQQLIKDITERYNTDFVKTWREYLQATRFAGYGSAPDIANKLGRLAANNSPLLEVICVASENTAVAAKDITDIFQPTQAVAPPPCIKKLNSSANAGYITGLLNLQNAVAQIRDLKAPDAIGQVNTVNQVKGQGETIARTLATGFNRDSGKPKVDEKTTAILLDPLRFTLEAPDPDLAAANDAAGKLCNQANPFLNKYPFNPGSPTEATIQEVNALLKPGDGTFWKLFDVTFSKILVRQGNDFAPNPQTNLKVNPGFLAFMNRLLHMSNAFYKSGSSDPSFSFTMQPLAAPDVDHVTLTIDGSTLSQDMRSPAKQSFTWPGSAQEAHLKVRFTGGTEFAFVESTGLWAIWHFLDRADKWIPTGSQYEVDWTLKTGTPPSTVNVNNHPATARFMLDPQSSGVFRPASSPKGVPCSVKAASK